MPSRAGDPQPGRALSDRGVACSGDLAVGIERGLNCRPITAIGEPMWEPKRD